MKIRKRTKHLGKCLEGKKRLEEELGRRSIEKTWGGRKARMEQALWPESRRV